MRLYLLDTDTLSLFWRNHPLVVARLATVPPEEIAITVVSVEEMIAGWQDQVRRARNDSEKARAYQRLTDTIPFLAAFRIVSSDEHALTRYASLRAARLNMGAMDLRIAAIALEIHATVVTRNVRDFSRVPGLLLEDWSQADGQ